MKLVVKSLLKRLISRLEFINRREFALVVLLISPLIIMAAYQPEFLGIGIHAVNLLDPARNIGAGFLYTHTCIVMTAWSPIWYGPMTVYMLAPFIAISNDPLMLYAVASILAVAGGVLLYYFCKEFFGSKTAIVALWIYASSSYIPNMVRKIHHQAYLPFFVILAIYSLFKMRFKKQWGYGIPFVIGIAFVLQNHVSLIPLVLLLLFVPWRAFLRQRRHVLAAALVGLLLFLPYLAYFYEERAWILEVSMSSLRRGNGEGSESMLSVSDPLSLSYLKESFFEPVIDIAHFKHHHHGSLPTRTGISVYAMTVLALAVIGFAFIIGSHLSASLKEQLSCDTRHLILSLLLVAGLVWSSLFPHHGSHHLLLPFIIAGVLAGTMLSWLATRSRVLLWMLKVVLICGGLVSTLGVILTIGNNIRNGASPTDSGLFLTEERALSEYAKQNYPLLRGDRILIMDSSGISPFVMHSYYSGLWQTQKPLHEETWRKDGSCGPRMMIPVPWHQSDEATGMQLPESVLRAHESTYLLVFRGHSDFLRQLNLPMHKISNGTYVVEVTSPSGKEATIETSPEKQFRGEPPLGRNPYTVSVPSARIDIYTFPPLAKEDSVIVYRYRFNETREQGTRWFIYSSDLSHHIASHYLDGTETPPSETFNEGYGLRITVPRGEHEFAIAFEEDKRRSKEPTMPFNIHFFELMSESVERIEAGTA